MSVEVEVWRGPVVESRHRVAVAVVDAVGRLRAWSGDPDVVVFARSAVKPFQALPLVDDGVADRLGFEPAELALCCASHNAEPRHVDAAHALLRKAGAGEEALACGARSPMSRAAARELEKRGLEPTRVHNECSGKHAGMLALARAHGWPLAGYHRAEHPVQQRMLEEISRWTEIPPDEIPTGVDGCGVVTFALPLRSLAGAFARLAAAARRGDAGPARIVRAMVENPEYVAGTERLCTELMRAADGRIFAKVGAEGVYCAGIPGAELAVALKVLDGSDRASGPALLGTLASLGLLSEEELETIERFASPEVENSRGERVGRLQARVELETPGD